MKNCLAVMFTALLLAASPVFAGDGSVSQATLSALGLGGMQTISDQEGMQVRGMSSYAFASGRSLVFGQLVNPETDSFLVLSDTNGFRASAEDAGLNARSEVLGGFQGSAIEGVLNEGPPFPIYMGSILAGAGNYLGLGFTGVADAWAQ